MPEAVDYFSNHPLKLRLPWRLYQGPLVSTAARVVRESSAAERWTSSSTCSFGWVLAATARRPHDS
ncbi:hypothetical protein [Archangium violaceum]|uniref:Uncharacterized protein n=1 Tax=Archangium violaceum Cb vi76 TaxID=1406225 RepID=A0A084SV31_9BACT|nr:hypothetical protein [Archangium violaceum]KFA92316.1 hypothetical protein Q664_16050 [Archangium violaceum Cb vi76]